MIDRDDIVPPMESATVDAGLRLWWFGGPSYALKSPRALVLVDPYHSGPRADDPRGFVRAIPNYFSPGAVTRADVVVSTHDHTDHCDPDTLRPIYERTGALFVAAPSSAEKMFEWGFAQQRIVTLAPGRSTTVGDVTLRAYPSRDWEDEGAVNFVLSSGGANVFIGGDTLLFDGLAEIGRAHEIDLAVLALARNRRDLIDTQLYADPPELARAALALRARRVLPVHWDIWRAWVEDPYAVAPHLAGTGSELVILPQGGSLDIHGDGAGGADGADGADGANRRIGDAR